MEKISKAQVKFVRSLQLKKVRDAEGLFVAEGEKCVEELRRGFELVYYIQTAEKPLPNLPLKGQEVATLMATPAEIEQMSSLKTPQGVIGVFRKNGGLMNGDAAKPLNGGMMQDGLILVLDGVQDPHEIVCSKDTADCYNPKVVQATMGALARVNLRYLDLPEWLEGIRNQESGIRIYGTLLDGKNMYEVLSGVAGLSASKASGLCSVSEQSERSVIIMGNEGNGISAAVRKFITDPIYIPTYPNKETSDVVESLNVSIATAIVLAEFRRPR